MRWASFKNELADCDAGKAAEEFGRHQSKIGRSKMQFREVYKVAKRIATIEASIWGRLGNRERKAQTVENLCRAKPML